MINGISPTEIQTTVREYYKLLHRYFYAISNKLTVKKKIFIDKKYSIILPYLIFLFYHVQVVTVERIFILF